MPEEKKFVPEYAPVANSEDFGMPQKIITSPVLPRKPILRELGEGAITFAKSSSFTRMYVKIFGKSFYVNLTEEI